MRRIVGWLLVAWCLPATLLGLVVAALGFSRWVGWSSRLPGGEAVPWRAMVFCLRPQSPLGWFFRRGGVGGLVRGGVAAITVGQVIVVASPGYAASSRLIVHELRHVLQGLALGPLLLGAYPAFCLAAWALEAENPYFGNDLEERAYQDGALTFR